MSARERARTLVLRYGDAATAYQILNPGMSYWFCDETDTVIGYVRRFGVRIVAGPPVCPPNLRNRMVNAFTNAAARHGERVVWTLVPEALAHRGRLWIGAQPWWTPQGFCDAIHGKASLRAQIARATNKGVSVRLWTTADGTTCLRRCLAEWLGTKGLPALHFLVEPNTLSDLTDRIVVIAEHDADVIGFCILSPIALTNAWLIEQQVRIPRAANGTGELLLHAAARELTARGATAMTLGLSPLSRRCEQSTEPPEWWQRWLRADGPVRSQHAGATIAARQTRSVRTRISRSSASRRR
jgi:phosphatidylglycerol lysyltransferase